VTVTDHGRLVVEVTDDGIGGADAAAGTGLAGIAKRVAALDGALTVTSPPGGPTTVRAELP
jgi:signal transduction histidine kinase